MVQAFAELRYGVVAHTLENSVQSRDRDISVQSLIIRYSR